MPEIVAKTPRRQDAKESGQAEPDVELDRLANRVIGCAIEVHRHLGAGLLESVYERALDAELRIQKIPFIRQPAFSINYKNCSIGEGRVDFLIDQKLILELKSVELLMDVHSAQALSYCRLTGCRLALLINFNVPELRRGIRRIINSHLLGVLASWRLGDDLGSV